MQPNLLVLLPKKLHMKVAMFGQEYEVLSIPWDTIVSVDLYKPRNSTDAEHWTIQIAHGEKDKLDLKFSALATAVDRSKFLSALDQYAPHATRDPELLQALAPANKRSYTELWLQSLAAPTERKSLVPLIKGHTLAEGRYVIDEQIGVGGQGVAYLAYDRLAQDHGNSDTPQKIVLKEFVLPMHVEKKVRQQSLERFEQESRILRTLDHPGVVKILDNFVEDHRGYLVLEHIDGSSLRDKVVREGGLHEEQVKGLLTQMCAILDYLHSLQPPLVHRDFTPDNLILDKSGVLKLIDFNVAQQKQKTGTATVVGKHAYLPPEQFRGRPTTRSDIFALGCTVYFLLTGEDPEPLTQSSLPTNLRDTSPVLNGIIQKCTALNELERYESAREINVHVPDAKVLIAQSAAESATIKMQGEKEAVLGKEVADG